MFLGVFLKDKSVTSSRNAFEVCICIDVIDSYAEHMFYV